ncbi:MAG: hypothetical protein ABSH48_11545 [Verrucomicrobiota bacterium]
MAKYPDAREQREAHRRRVFRNVGSADGSIMATIMASHISRNIAADIVQDCPGIRIQVMDMIQPPGIPIPPDIERQK